MYVDYCGWSPEKGPYHEQIFVDENRVDHTIYYSDGKIARQVGGFTGCTVDWNHDNDVYTKYGAWFEFANKEGAFIRGAFFTPEDLVRFALEAQNPEAQKNKSHVTKVTGITLPGRKPPFEEQVRQTEARALHQEIERNRKMQSLGIRPSNEPWAR